MADIEPTLALRCQRSRVLSSDLGAALAEIRSESDRGEVALRAISLAHEHHSAFLCLIYSMHFASAAALLRPIAEASACAHWVTYVARPEWVTAALTEEGRDQPSLDRMITQLASSGVPIAGIKDMRKLLQTPTWKVFHSFTHGGLSQLARRGNAETFDVHANRANIYMAESFLLAGAAIATVWTSNLQLRELLIAERSRQATELREAFDGPEISQWEDLPPPRGG